MPDRDSGEDLSRLVADLVTTLEELEDELDPPSDRGVRLPTPRELRRFASEVAIPGLILVLETNIRALRLLQRALQLAEGADRTREEASQLPDRARSVSERTLDRLDDALVELQDAVEGRPNDDEAAALLDDARELRAEVQSRLREYGVDAADRARENGRTHGESRAKTTVENENTVDDQEDGESTTETGDGEDDSEPVEVDVDAELRSIKDEIEDATRRVDRGDGIGEDDESTPADSDESTGFDSANADSEEDSDSNDAADSE